MCLPSWGRYFLFGSYRFLTRGIIISFSGNLNRIAKRINSTGNIYEEDMAEVKAIMDEVWRTQKAMLKKQPLIHNG